MPMTSPNRRKHRTSVAGTRSLWALCQALPAAALLVAVTVPGAALRAQTVVPCLGDGDLNGEVTVDEIVTSVNNALTGCGLEPVTIKFRAVVGDRPFACGQVYDQIGTANSRIIPSDLRFYLHNIRLVNDKGGEVPVRLTQDHKWQYQDVVLLDFENKTPPCNQGTVQLNDEIHGSVPSGTYTGIRFTLGVPFALNHGDSSTAPSPLSLSAMFWGWRAGYKFIRFDDAQDLVRLHVGSTACVGPNPSQTIRCDRLNLGEAYLPSFTPATDEIIADVAALFSDSDLSVNTPDTAPGCESSPNDLDCDPVFANLGINFSNGLPDPSHQKFFRAQAAGSSEQ